MWLGFDAGDPLFDNDSARGRIDAALRRMAAGRPVTFHWVRYQNMEGKVFWIYNDLFRQVCQIISRLVMRPFHPDDAPLACSRLVMRPFHPDDAPLV